MKIFVYGSLRKGFGNHRVLGKSPFLTMASTPPTYTMVNLGHFPGVINAGNTSIVGELYDVGPSILEQLDRLEGHPDFYRRTPIVVTDANGSEHNVETYLLSADWLDRNTVIQSGNWAQRGGL